jgi:hypothetical protein
MNLREKMIHREMKIHHEMMRMSRREKTMTFLKKSCYHCGSSCYRDLHHFVMNGHLNFY